MDKGENKEELFNAILKPHDDYANTLYMLPLFSKVFFDHLLVHMWVSSPFHPVGSYLVIVTASYLFEGLVAPVFI